MKSRTLPFPRTSRASAGFTLVELLVVIVIGVALAALGFAALTRTRNQAITAADTSKLRQVAIAIAAVAQENNNIVPHNNRNKPGYGIPNTEAVSGEGNRFNFHEAIDRYFPPPPNFNPTSIYNYETRVDSGSIYCSKAAKPWAGYKPSGSRKLPGPLWFSVQTNMSHGNWAGNLMLVPNPSTIVIVAETNHMGGEMRPKDNATSEGDEQSRYRVSRAGGTALYLFVDGHVERLKGDRGEAYYATHRDETNIWKWW